jgi:hypothetical protein
MSKIDSRYDDSPLENIKNKPNVTSIMCVIFLWVTLRFPGYRLSLVTVELRLCVALKPGFHGVATGVAMCIGFPSL